MLKKLFRKRRKHNGKKRDVQQVGCRTNQEKPSDNDTEIPKGDYTTETKQRQNEQPEPAAIKVFLDEAPLIMNKPLILLNGHAYAATWLVMKITEYESKNREGKIVKHRKPKVTHKDCLFIIRDDGVAFCEEGVENTENLDQLEIEIHLLEKPPQEKLWTKQGVKSFLNGDCPKPSGVFNKIVDVISQFIDFSRSLADQQTMAELIACYVLSTWFLDAFNVIGFLWPNGDRGTGKTQLLNIIAELSYLGQVILAGGSYACLRDMADYGATLAFDDAENFSNPKSTDPDKRALLLAGNRRGNSVQVKEPIANRGWVTRYVNTFCPRLFSATKLPDPILASRTIIIPLTRSPDCDRANSDPLDFDLWLHDKRQLCNDLWALGLAHLTELNSYEKLVNEHARLKGRNLEPWKAILAVAYWLDANGKSGIWERMEALSWKYHMEEQSNLQTGDLTYLVIRALVECAISAIKANSAVKSEWFFPTSQITKIVNKISQDEEVDTDRINSKIVGRCISTLRFKPHRPDGSGPRGWIVQRNELESTCSSYGIKFPDKLRATFSEVDSSASSHVCNGTNGIDGINGTQNQMTLDDVINSSTYPDVSKSCFACGQSEWIERTPEQGGGWYCQVCNPSSE